MFSSFSCSERNPPLVIAGVYISNLHMISNICLYFYRQPTCLKLRMVKDLLSWGPRLALHDLCQLRFLISASYATGCEFCFFLVLYLEYSWVDYSYSCVCIGFITCDFLANLSSVFVLWGGSSWPFLYCLLIHLNLKHKFLIFIGGGINTIIWISWKI